MADPVCAAMVHGLWDLAARQLDAYDAQLALVEYRAALVERFLNPSIAHLLRQIAVDGSVKLRVRVIDPVLRELAAGGNATEGLCAISAWIRFVHAEHAEGRIVDDVASAEIARRAASDSPTAELLAFVSPELAANPVVTVAVHEQCGA